MNHDNRSEERKIPFRVNENSKWKRPNCLKRGKTRVIKLWLVLVLLLIGWVECSYPITEWNTAKPMQSHYLRQSIENCSNLRVALVISGTGCRSSRTGAAVWNQLWRGGSAILRRRPSKGECTPSSGNYTQWLDCGRLWPFFRIGAHYAHEPQQWSQEHQRNTLQLFNVESQYFRC